MLFSHNTTKQLGHAFLIRAIATLSTLAIALVGASTYAAANPFEGASYKDFDAPSVPHLKITLKESKFQQLLDKRNTALEQKVLQTETDDYVAAVIHYDNEKTRIKMRLKGDFVEHLLGDKWSFRVKVKGANALFGMKVFSLQHPRMRVFLHEWIAMEALRKEGLIALRHKFVKLSINGTYLGLFHLEEHFEKRLVENNSRREGPIFKLDESLLFELIRQGVYDGGKHDSKLFFTSEILPFQKSKTVDSPLLRDQFLKAQNLLHAFRSGKARVADVFNLEQLAKYYIITDVFMGKHGNRWHNQRFYFNPIDSRIEPIGFDFNDDKAGLDTLKRINKGNGLFYGTNWTFDVFSRYIFSDPVFFTEYMRQAKRLTEPKYMQNFLASIESDVAPLQNILEQEFDTNEFRKFIKFDNNMKKSYYDNQRYVRDMLTKKMELDVHLKNANKNSLSVILANRDQHLLHITGYTIEGQRFNLPEPFLLHTSRFYNKFVPESNNIAQLDINTKIDPRNKPITFLYKTVGNDAIWQTPLITEGNAPSPKPQFSFPRPWDAGHPMRRKTNIEDFDFLVVNNQVITAKPGKWTLDKTLIIPKGYRVNLAAGMQLDLLDNASIISRSPVNSLGTEQQPVKLFSSNGSGGGVFVHNALTQSTWTFTEVNDLTPPSHREWRPTGAVTFYKSPVSISNSQFKSNRAEDSLNTINTTVHLADNYFSGATSDAFDADFCQGTLENNTFENIGNDAVDVSGTVLKVVNLTIKRAGDKGVSAGERSTVTIDSLLVNHATTAAASKDDSKLTINGATLKNNTIGLVVYQKKPEYGPATIDARDTVIESTELPTLLEPGSSIFIDGAAVKVLARKKQKLIFDSLKNGRNLN